MRDFSISCNRTPKEVAALLNGILLSDRDRSSLARLSTPDVYDRLMGEVYDQKFQAVIYGADVNPNSVVAEGKITASDQGSLVKVSFTWGSAFSRATNWLALAVGILLLSIAAASGAVTLIALAAAPVAYFLYRFCFARFERARICDNLKSGLSSVGA